MGTRLCGFMQEGQHKGSAAGGMFSCHLMGHEEDTSRRQPIGRNQNRMIYYKKNVPWRYDGKLTPAKGTNQSEVYR